MDMQVTSPQQNNDSASILGNRAVQWGSDWGFWDSGLCTGLAASYISSFHQPLHVLDVTICLDVLLTTTHNGLKKSYV